ncbi:MAG: hypothetical protein A2W19_08915 [Spirochaetes bacterium RBG_16_49_21]|nr:MAG: hypothetical protein A2W19_08915 [Spirochaetes bacterium RBG_16_49_21]
MSRFTEILTVSPLSDGKTWIIRKKFGYDVGREGGAEFVDVPVGFMTDFASVPRLLWAIIPRWGTYGNAAVIHDYCYWCQQISVRRKRKIINKNINRKKADRIFFEAMGVLRVTFYYRYTIYWAVRLFGLLQWRANQRGKRKGVQRVLRRIPKKTAGR